MVENIVNSAKSSGGMIILIGTPGHKTLRYGDKIVFQACKIFDFDRILHYISILI